MKNHPYPRLPISVVMLTLNEAHHLPGALANVRQWAEDVFILDSLSTDRTVDIALEYGATVVQRPFTNFGDQWNFALSHFPVRTRWTMKLDPDERVSDNLLADMAAAVESANYDAYTMPRRLWFMGRPLHVRADVLRLWRTGRCRFSDVLVNEHPEPDGPVGRLRGWLEHHDSPDLHHWLEKQNRYTTLEAVMKTRGDALADRPSLMGTSNQRRMFLKRNFHRIPCRFHLLWLYNYLLKGAWRDGREGRAWAHLRVEIMRMRELKALEMAATGRIPELPRAAAGNYDPRLLEQPLQQKVLRTKPAHHAAPPSIPYEKKGFSLIQNYSL